MNIKQLKELRKQRNKNWKYEMEGYNIWTSKYDELDRKRKKEWKHWTETIEAAKVVEEEE